MSARKTALVIALLAGAVFTTPALADGRSGVRGGETQSSNNQSHGNGSVASELKGLNASNANANAFANANGNSAVGFLANLKTLVDEACTAPTGDEYAVELANLLANPPARPSDQIAYEMELLSMNLVPYDDPQMVALQVEYDATTQWESRVAWLQGYIAQNGGGADTGAGCTSPADVVRDLLADRDLSDEAMNELLGRLGY